MLLCFQEQSPQKIIANLKKAIKKNSLDDKVSIILKKQRLNVEINYLGSSQLIFKPLEKTPGNNWRLESKQLALSHQIFTSKALIYLENIIKTAGGQIKKTKLSGQSNL